MIEELLQQLIERLDNRYFGKYRGYVSNVSDPQKQGRIKAYVPRLLGEAETGWAMPCSAYAGPDQGLFTVPELGAGRVHKEKTLSVDIPPGVDEGNRTTFVDGDDYTRVGGRQTEEVIGGHDRTVNGSATLHVRGDYQETIDAAGYSRTIDSKGFSESFTGPRNDNLKGSYTRRVSGAVDDTAMGGFGLTSGGNVQIAAGKAFKVAAVMPDLPGPSLNAISMDALIGNLSFNTLLGFCQLGGMSAISPMVLGDGLAIHFLMLAQILKIVNPLTMPAYGPLLDTWAAMTPLIDWSYFGFVKRFPFG